MYMWKYKVDICKAAKYMLFFTVLSVLVYCYIIMQHFMCKYVFRALAVNNTPISESLKKLLVDGSLKKHKRFPVILWVIITYPRRSFYLVLWKEQKACHLYYRSQQAAALEPSQQVFRSFTTWQFAIDTAGSKTRNISLKHHALKVSLGNQASPMLLLQSPLLS